MAKETKPRQKPRLAAFQNEIRKRAEELCKERTEYNDPGDTLSDWLQAEKEIKKKYGL
jgi:hypothetical protein